MLLVPKSLKNKNMKKNLLSVLLTMSIYVSYSQAYIYHAFPGAGALWSVKWDGAMYCQEIDYFSVGDTVVNNTTYQKVWATGVEIYCIVQATLDTFSTYAGAYRNDTLSKRVYWLQPDSLNEKLLYDFDVNIGDTLDAGTFNLNSNGIPVVVKAIDSIQINDSSYRRDVHVGWYNNPIPFHQIIEGIGSDGGLIEKIWDGISDLYYLKCFTTDSISLFNYGGFLVNAICKSYIPNIVVEINKDQNVLIYPNPTNGLFSFSPKILMETVQLYTVTGQTINFIQTENELDITSHPAGLYLVEASDGKNIYWDKLIKQ
jgi:hypothetical protein